MAWGDLEYWNPTVLGITAAIELVIVLLLFKFSMASDASNVFGMKVAAACVMLPIIYAIVYNAACKN